MRVSLSAVMRLLCFLYFNPCVVLESAQYLVRTGHDVIVLGKTLQDLNVGRPGYACFYGAEQGNAVFQREDTFFFDLFLVVCTICLLVIRISIEFTDGQRLYRNRQDFW